MSKEFKLSDKIFGDKGVIELLHTKHVRRFIKLLKEYSRIKKKLGRTQLNKYIDKLAGEKLV